MLKNPAYLFRTDGKNFKFNLFKAQFFKFDKESMKDFNYGIALKHLMVNRAIEPNGYQKPLPFYDNFFLTNPSLDFRPEYIEPDNYRIAVVNYSNNANAVINTTIRKIFRKAAAEVYNTEKINVDVLYYVSLNAYYVEYSYLKAEIIESLNAYKNYLKKNKYEFNLIMNPAVLHSHLLVENYKNQKDKLAGFLEQIKSGLKEKNSILHVKLN